MPIKLLNDSMWESRNEDFGEQGGNGLAICLAWCSCIATVL